MTDAGGSTTPDAEQHRAEARMRAEMARARRAEATQLRTLKLGCTGVIVLLVVALVLAFVLG